MKFACPHYEREIARGRAVIGVDEVGRGPLAGPVVAAAAFLPDTQAIEGLRDSKTLTEKRRNALTIEILGKAVVALGGVSAAGIDRLGIGPATKLAMQRAVAALVAPDEAIVLIDGNQAPFFEGREVMTEVKADGSCPSVAAAAIVAKVTRDRAMARLCARYEAYGWSSNKGYGSAQHRAAILTEGVSPHHRRSFLGRILGERAA